MTFKVLVAGLHSLRVSTPGLIFLGVAVLLVVLPRRFSAAAGTGTAMAASAAALLAMIVASTPALPEQTDLVKDRLSQLGPAWLAVVIPIVVSCFQRSTSIHRGIAVAGAHLSAGALCFAMAARTPSLLLLSLTLAMIGATTIPLGAESETRGSRLAGRWALFSAMMWALFFIGLSMATRAPVARVHEAQPVVYRSTHLVGSVVATIALFGLLGWGPTSRWMQGGSVGVRLATSTVYAMIATISYLKLFPVIHIESVMTVVWAWSMASLLYHLGSLRTTRLDDFASSALAFWTSVATGMLVTAHGEARNEVVVGAISLLIFVSVLGPALGAVIDACTLNLNGDLGNPFGPRSVALKSSLYMLAER